MGKDKTDSKSSLLAELEERLKFETLLADISARFVNLSADQIDSEIEDAQRRVCECIGLDLATLWQWTVENPYIFMLTHLYRRFEGPPAPEKMDAREYFPWTQQQTLAGKVVAISTLDELPAEAARDKESRRHYGVKSLLAIPLSTGGALIGVLSFNTIQKECTWPEALVKRLQLIAQIFANALYRKRADMALRESEERLNLAISSADTGLWIMDVSMGVVWVTDKLRDLFGFTPDEELSLERFLAVIHPEDREGVREIVQQSLKNKKLFIVEFRIIRSDGSIRWIVARGRLYSKAAGVSGRLMGVSADITERKEMETKLRENLEEIKQLKLQLEKENIYLREDLKAEHGFEKIVGKSDALHYVLFRAKQVAPTDTTVLIMGETGTGKGMIAHAVHEQSRRKDRPLITVNCAGLPSNLIESELFGREKGAFTGAHAMQEGRFEVADGGTIFLDEIGELPRELQSKLLRVLESGEFERLGSPKTRKVDVRVLAATSRDLKDEIQHGRFRQDLFYRLNVFPITIPPLRDRQADIPELVNYFLQKYIHKIGRNNIKSIPKHTMETLKGYSWPGNVRELEHVIERAVIISHGSSLQLAEHIEAVTRLSDSKARPLKDLASVEREHMLKVLNETDWKIEGERGAAEILGLNPSTLRSRMKRLNIQRA